MFEINWQIMLSQVLTFLIALVIVWKFGWKGMTKFIRDRQEKIKKTIDDAEQTRKAIAKLEDEYRAKLEQVEQKTSTLLSLARDEGLRIKDEIVKAAQVEAAELRKKSSEQLAQDRQRIVSEIRSEIITLSMAVAEKALREGLAGEVHDRKFREILDELSHPRRPA